MTHRYLLALAFFTQIRVEALTQPTRRSSGSVQSMAWGAGISSGPLGVVVACLAFYVSALQCVADVCFILPPKVVFTTHFDYFRRID